MGLTYATISVTNPVSTKQVPVRALVDSGSNYFCIPAATATESPGIAATAIPSIARVAFARLSSSLASEERND